MNSQKNAFVGKKCLVTGACGLLGFHIVDALMGIDDVEVIASGRNEEKLKALFHKYSSNKRFSTIVGDVADGLQIGAPLDFIFHAAGPIAGDIVRTRPLDVILPNIYGTKFFLDYLKEQNFVSGKSGRLILFSSATVYSNHFDEDISFLEDESDCAESLDSVTAPYSESKRYIEVLAKAYNRQFDVDTVIARLSYLYGYSHFYSNTAFYEFVQKILHGENIVIKNPCISRRDNIYVDDAVEGLLFVAANGKKGESYNISSNGELGNYVAVDEIAELICRISRENMDKKGSVVYLEQKETARRKPGYKLDNSKAKALGWDGIRTSMKEGLYRTLLKYEEEHRELM